jgi:hypothetical protein
MIQLAITDCRKECNIDYLLAEGCTIVGHYQHSTMACVRLLNFQQQLEKPEMNFCP